MSSFKLKIFLLSVTALPDTRANRSDASEQVDAIPNKYQQLQTERNKESQGSQLGSQPEEVKLELDTVPVNRFRNNNTNEIITLLDSNASSNVVPEPSSELASEPLVPTERTIMYEDVEMTYTSLPKPFNITSLTIIKRQNDIFSGNMPFNVTVIDWLSKIY